MQNTAYFMRVIGVALVFLRCGGELYLVCISVCKWRVLLILILDVEGNIVITPEYAPFACHPLVAR